MQIIIHNTPQQVAKEAATWLKSLINKKPNVVLGLATGSTPINLYQELVQAYVNKEISFKSVSTFNLDEYYDISPGNPQSYRSFMNQHLFSQVDIALDKTYLPVCKKGQNPKQQGRDYEEQIAQAGGIDIQVLGIGANGHIGFNEPTSSLASRTRIKSLTKQTLVDNSRLFKDGEPQPNMAMTMGIGTIIDAHCVLLMATGKNKAEAVNKMITGPVTSACPASVLQMHQNVVVILDQEAASQLENQDYFQQVNEQNIQLSKEFGLLHNFDF